MGAGQEPTQARRIELILQQVESLPTLSPIATRLMNLGSAEDADLKEVVRLIESDPALTAKILGLCRRADRGVAQTITTVHRAVIMLGLEAVRSAVLSVTVYELMADTAHPMDEQGDGEKNFDHAGFWRHAIAVACCAELVVAAHKSPNISGEEAFVAGLLHDLGKLVLDLILPQSYSRVLKLSEQHQSNSAVHERAVLGLDHHTAGKRIAEYWQLPQFILDVIWLHSQPARSMPDGPSKGVTEIVTVAKAICRELHIGWSGDFGPTPSVTDLCRQFDMDAKVIDEAIPKLHDQVSDRCRLLGLHEESSPELLLQSIANANRRLSRANSVLERKGRASQQLSRILSAIVAFNASTRQGRRVLETLSDIVQSAAELFGDGFYAMLYQQEDGEPWQVCQFDGHGELVRSQVFDPPPVHGGRISALASLTDPSQISMATIGILPWLSDFIIESEDMRKVRLHPLNTSPGNPTGAVLLHDREMEAGAGSKEMLQALTSTWGGAIAAAFENESASRLGEQLAELNRSLSEMQSQLTQTETMAHLGEMTAGAAHEMNNPLTVISGRGQLLAAKLRTPANLAAAEAICQAAEDLSELITSLHLLSDPPEPSPAPTNVRRLLETAVEYAQGRIGTELDIEIEVVGDLEEVVVDSGMLQRATTELVTNAIEAAPGAKVRIRAQTDPLDGRLLVSVIDKGPGMSDKALKHAFDPFFSDKPAGRQTGLGLTRARHLTELLGGQISIAHRTEGGIVASITLPAPVHCQTANATNHAL